MTDQVDAFAPTLYERLAYLIRATAAFCREPTAANVSALSSARKDYQTSWIKHYSRGGVQHDDHSLRVLGRLFDLSTGAMDGSLLDLETGEISDELRAVLDRLSQADES